MNKVILMLIMKLDDRQEITLIIFIQRSFGKPPISVDN